MHVDMRVVLSFAVTLILGLAAWSLRPQQPRAVSPRWFIGGAKDGFFLLLFNPSGLPRKFAWCLPVSLAWFLSRCSGSFFRSVAPNYSFKRTAATGCGTIMRRSAAAA